MIGIDECRRATGHATGLCVERELGAQKLTPLDLGAVVAQTSRDRVDERQTYVAAVAGERLVISHVSKKGAGHGMTEAQPKKSGFAVCVHLAELRSYEVWRDGKHIPSQPLAAGAMHIHDMRDSWLVDLQSAFDVVNFYIPQAAFDELTDEQDLPRAGELRCAMQAGKKDQVLSSMAMAFLPALARPDQANELFVDYGWRALAAHVLRAHSSSEPPPHRRGGLAPWQERRAKEMLLEQLCGNVTLRELAAACRLSSSHFSQAFRQTVGSPPHRWLVVQRVERSKATMLNTDLSLSEVALDAGFADQSHFTRVFSRIVGASPAAWRRSQER